HIDAAVPLAIGSSGSGRASNRHSVAWLAGLLAIASGCAVAAALTYLRAETLRTSENLTGSLARVIEEQISRTLQAADQRLELAGSRLRVLQAERRLDEDTARAMLREQLKELAFVRAIWVLDSSGRIVYDTDLGNIGVSLADREYFQVYQQRPATAFHISAPVRSRTTGTWLIAVSRPLRSASGAVSGVMVAAVEPPYFEQAWSDIDLGQDGAIGLMRVDGALMLRSPRDDRLMDKSFASLPLFTEHLPRSPSGQFQSISAFDSVERLTAYRRLSVYPQLVVYVGRTSTAMLGTWTRFATVSLSIWLAAIAGLGLLSLLLYRNSRAREQTELRFGELAQAMPQIVFITDASGHMVFINDQWIHVTGQPVEAARNSGWFLRVHPDDLERTADDFRNAIESTQSMHNEHRLLCADGSYRWQLARVIPNRDAQGRVVAYYGTSTDIDDLKQAEAAMKTQADLLSMAGQLSRMGGWALELPGMRFRWSQEASFVLELPPGSVPTLETAIELCTPRSQTLASTVAQQCIEHGTPFDVEVEMITGAGRNIWVRSMGRAVYNAQGRMIRVQGALQDVTARVLAEREVQAQLQTLQGAAEAAQAITRHHNLDAMMQEVAEQARTIIGAHQAIISLTQNSDWAQAITALSLSDKYAAWRHLAEPPDGSGIYAVVCETNRPLRLTQAELEAHPRWRGFGAYADKHPAMRGWLAVPLTGRDGTNIGVLQLSDKMEGDFTQQDEYIATELAELAQIAIDNVRLLAQVQELNSGLEEKIAQRTADLTRQEALFRALAEQAPQPIWTLDPTGAATFASRAWYALCGGAPPDWMGHAWLALVHPDDLADLSEQWKEASKTGQAYTGTRRLRARDGNYHTMSYRSSPVFNNSGELLFWVGIDIDITELKAVETALRISNSELEAFSYSVSHDLRAPLNTVDGFSRLLAKELGHSQSDRTTHYLSRIQAGVTQMGQLIEGLLSLAHVTRQALRVEPVNLSQLAREVLDSLRAHSPGRHADITVAPDLRAQGDTRLLRAVMENLLGNAWKFSERRERATIEVGWSAGQQAFFVRDNGAGFDMAYANKLFGTFQRLHGSTEFAGTGIGLATVARVIARHGGRIWAEAAPDQGATFYFVLPGA
ncbi:MAG: PAS domain-containing protein, partial [Polaromonas sp.]|uniref:PAS domain-containing protein n=1 Tax=Polaromonas sp. TaxID=1869339 RepID=UPI0040366FE9